MEKRVVHLGVGTPGRIKELIKQGMKRGSNTPYPELECLPYLCVSLGNHVCDAVRLHLCVF